MVVATFQANKVFKNWLVQTNLRITIQVPLKPNLASYENQLKFFLFANVINVFLKI